MTLEYFYITLLNIFPYLVGYGYILFLRIFPRFLSGEEILGSIELRLELNRKDKLKLVFRVFECMCGLYLLYLGPEFRGKLQGVIED